MFYNHPSPDVKPAEPKIKPSEPSRREKPAPFNPPKPKVNPTPKGKPF